MNSPHHFHWKNQNLWLLSERAIFWEEQCAIILSDAHFGKAAHFRKEGIAVPQSIFLEDIQRLVSLIQFYNAKQLIIIGDMFHSKTNKEHDFFLRWRNDFAALNILLVKGNHDILKNDWYSEAGIKIYSEELLVDKFLFMHDVSFLQNKHNNYPFAKDALYVFSGHIHPGISIKSTGRQSLTFPCFYFGEKFAVLPAFGKFTGVSLINREKKDTVFAIVNKEVIKV